MCTFKILRADTCYLFLWKATIPVHSLLFTVNIMKPKKAVVESIKEVITSTKIPLSHSNLKEVKGSSPKKLTAQIRKNYIIAK